MNQQQNARPVRQARPTAQRTPQRSPQPGARRSPQASARPASRAAAKKPSFLERQRKKRAYRKKRIAALTPKQRAVYKMRRRKKIKRNIGRTLLSLATVLGVLVIALLSAGFIVFRGPSQSFGDIMTVTMLETSALKFVPHIYYSNSTVDAIVERNSIAAPTEDTDTSLINIDTGVDENGEVAEDYKDIEVFEVSGNTFKGFMMVVRDPSRVSVGVCRENFNSNPGLQLYEIAQKYNAVAAVNGGAFADSGGMGNGGTPGGNVISGGKLLFSRGNGDENVTVGFTKDDVLVVGEMTGQQAIDMGLRDAVTFGPALVINGEACEVSGISSGLNPRTAIGQREDGAVLLLVIDGRQVNSLGATHADLMRLMLEYGAVNACNLDGGSSSIMYYEGEYLNNGVAVTGSRKIPTAIIVR